MAEQTESCPERAAAEVVDRDVPIRSSQVFIVTSKLLKSQPSLSRAHLALTPTTLEVGDQQHESGAAGAGEHGSYLLEDVVGVVVNDSAPSYNKVACQMNIHVHQKKENRRTKKSSRKMTILSTCFDNNKTFDENKTEACEWKKAIKLHSYKRLRQVLHNHDSKGVI